MDTELEIRINAIGSEMAACAACELKAVSVTRGAGNPPRGLILEGAERAGKGCIIAGINPGRASPHEVNWRLQQPAGYAQQVEFFQERFGETAEQSNPYYGKLRDLARQLHLTGPILWTDVVKCESKREAKHAPGVAVQRTCAHRFLTKELQAVPEEWPVIAVGDAAFTAMSLLAPGRAVVGVPHASGDRSRPLYHSLFNDGQLIEYHRMKAQEAIASHQAIQLKGTRRAAR